LIDTWLELAAAMTVRDLAGDPEAPRASLAAGAAGFAYVLGRIGRARGDTQILAASRRWLASARRVGQRRDGFRAAGWRPTSGSVMFGPLGLSATAALIVSSPRAIADHVALARRRAARAPAEVMLGIAGNLMTAVALLRAPGDDALVRELAARLAKLPPPPVGGFAHGDVGVTAARLAAARALGTAIDGALVDSLAAIDPAHVVARGPLARSWCNGLAGYTLAWVLAAEVGNDERCRARALAAAPHLLDALDESGGTVCCGLGGRAYALLAIARLDPGGPWIEHARQLATRALAHETATGGVLQGLPGLVLLAHDLETPATARFPVLDI
jgi:eukaryotic-like serine/threonine-protein kinase